MAERTRPSLGISAPHAASLRQQAAVLCLRPPNAANPASEQARNPTHSVDLHVRHKKLQRRVLQVLARRTCVRANINHICRCSQAHHQCTGALGFGPVSAQATHRRGTGRRQLWPQFWRPPRACDGHGILARSSTPGCPQRCSRLRESYGWEAWLRVRLLVDLLLHRAAPGQPLCSPTQKQALHRPHRRQSPRLGREGAPCVASCALPALHRSRCGRCSSPWR